MMGPEIIEALKLIAGEISDLFWLIFWFGLFGAFGTTINHYKNKQDD